MKQGWEYVTLSSFAKTSAGGTPLKSNKDHYLNGTVPWLLSGEVGKRDVSEATNFITELGLANSSAKLFPTNTVLVAMYGATAGETGLLRFEASTNQAVCGIFPSEKHIPEYLYYFFLHFKGELVKQAIGNAQPNISQQKIKNTEIPLPPLEEQKRIVAVLDEAFAGLETARTNAEANLKNAEELFSAACEDLFSNVDNMSLHRLGDCVERLTNGYVGPTRDIYQTDGVPYLLAKHVKNNTLTFDDETFVTPEFNEKHKKSKLANDDVLLVQSGHIGHSAVVDEKHEGHNCHAMIVISTKKEVLTGAYLSTMFNTPHMQGMFQSIRTGSTVPHLTCKAVKELKIKVPDDYAVQVRITTTIAELQKRVEQTVAIQSGKLADITALRQSLLQKAFAGELT